MSPSTLHQYVFVLASKCDQIEDDLLNDQLDGPKSNAQTTAVSFLMILQNLDSQLSKVLQLVVFPTSITSSSIECFVPFTLPQLKRIVSILNQWTSSKDYSGENDATGEDHASDVEIDRLLNCCQKHLE